MATENPPKRPLGRPPCPEPERIPDTFENIIKALVKPRKDKDGKPSRRRESWETT